MCQAAVAKSAIVAVPAILASPVAAALTGGAVIVSGIAGLGYYLEQQNQKRHEENRMWQSGNIIVSLIQDDVDFVAVHVHGFSQFEFYESGMIKKLTLPANPVAAVIVACIFGAVYYLGQRRRIVIG